ncbi:MAG: MATE family efflux transporter [Candidatus Aminicenantes bacterium]|nr:MAG: MATE family efflux transporter [Candidatus Aminicenantes bacterium]
MKNTQQPAESASTTTKGVQTLLGNPKKAVVKLSIPMIVAMSVHTLYNFVDGLWVAGLGPDALSAVGFFFPFFFLIMALSAGIGVGGSAAVSRMIGAKDKRNADAVASHTMALMVIASLVLALPFFMYAPAIFSKLGAGPIATMAGEYARIIFGGTLIIFFGQVASALLRGEGDAKRAMTVMMIGSGMNIILDPIFIYLFKLGVAGAAWATIVSICFSSGYLFYWFFIKRDTFVSITFRGFRFKKAILWEILKVGIPVSFQQMTMSIAMLILNLIAVRAGGTDGVAIFTTGWRVVLFATLPLYGIATAVVSVTGAAYGGKAFKKLDSGYMYAIKFGVVIELVMAVITFILAPQIAWLFTFTQESVRIRADLINFLRIMCIFYPAVSPGMLSSAMFQGTGKGTYSLTVTFIRTILLGVPLAYCFAVIMGMKLTGLWGGIVLGNSLGAMIAFTWGRIYVRRLKATFSSSEVVAAV